MIDAMLRHHFNTDLGSLTPFQVAALRSRLPLVVEGFGEAECSRARAGIRKAGRYG